MTKSKKWTLRLLGVAALALLICLCLLGSTMARYTSEGKGSGSLTVAVWDLETTTADLEVDGISPAQDAYTDSGYGFENARTHDSGSTRILTMENNSDVDALVYLDLGTGLELTPAAGFTFGTGFADGYNQEANDYGMSIMEGFTETTFKAVLEQYGVITLTLTDEYGNTTYDEENPIEIAAEDSVDIYADVVWTSIYSGAIGADPGDPYKYGFASDETATDDEWAAFSDAVDTILGMYYTTISFNVNWTAVQNSVKP